MATYNDCLRQIALAVNAITGATASTLESSYVTTPLTVANFQSSILPFTNLKDHMLNAQGRIITAAAYEGNHPYRAALTSQTAALSDGDEVIMDAASVAIIGVWGAVRNQDGDLMTEGNLSQIRARNLNPGTMFLVDTALWARDDVRIYHTATTATIDVVAYSRPSAVSLSLSANILLPDDAVPAIVSGALEECVRDDEFIAQAQKFGGMFSDWVGSMMNSRSVNSTAQPVETAASV